MIKSKGTVIKKAKTGATLARGNHNGWNLWKDGERVASVHPAVAEDAIDSGELRRVDDRTTKCGEEWGA